MSFMNKYNIDLRFPEISLANSLEGSAIDIGYKILNKTTNIKHTSLALFAKFHLKKKSYYRKKYFIPIFCLYIFSEQLLNTKFCRL